MRKPSVPSVKGVSVDIHFCRPLASFVSAGVEYGFKVSDDAGAVLFLESPAMKESILSKQQIVAYMRQNFDSWLEHANTGNRGFGLKQDDIVFISGTTKTTRWANAAFHGSYKQQAGTISGGVDNVGKLDVDNKGLDPPLIPAKTKSIAVCLRYKNPGEKDGNESSDKDWNEE